MVLKAVGSTPIAHPKLKNRSESYGFLLFIYKYRVLNWLFCLSIGGIFGNLGGFICFLCLILCLNFGQRFEGVEDHCLVVGHHMGISIEGLLNTGVAETSADCDY